MKRHTTVKRVSLKNKVGPLQYTHHRREITANGIPFFIPDAYCLVWLNYGSEKIVAEVMSGCGFESIHSCYVRRLRVMLRNVSAHYCFKHFLFPWVQFLQTRSGSGRWVVDFFPDTSIKMKLLWSGQLSLFDRKVVDELWKLKEAYMIFLYM